MKICYNILCILTGTGLLICNGVYSQVSFTASRVCLGNPTKLQNTSNINSTMLIEWDLNNDGFFNEANGDTLLYTFATADTFEIRLRITDSTGTEFFSNSPQPVIVDPSPYASFFLQKTCFGDTTIFINQSNLPNTNPLTYEWDFTDDGIKDDSIFITKFYFTSAGNYTTKLTAVSNQGCVSVTTKTFSITQPPVANFSLNDVCLNTPNLFVNQSQYTGSMVKQLIWNLGDNNFDFNHDTVFHTYTNVGNYLVKLTAVDTSGCKDTIQKSVAVSIIPEASFQTIGTCFGQTILYINNSTIEDGTALNYQWDFENDGITDETSANTTFQYSAFGNYTIKLTAFSNQNCSASVTNDINIKQPPIANFSLPSACLYSPIFFQNQTVVSGSPAQQTIWNFGDNSQSFNADTVSHSFATTTTFQIKLTVIDNSGCRDSITKALIVNPLPDYTISLSNGNEFFEGQNTEALITGNFATMIWEDNSISPNRTLTLAGNYSFRVSSGLGCSATDSFSIHTNPPPTVLQPANDFLTPNADGKNDVLVFKNMEVFTGCKLKVFDERGLQVFSNEDYKNDWSGANNNAGAYLYFLKCNEVPEVKGITNLIR